MIERTFKLELHSKQNIVSDVAVNQGNVNTTLFKFRIFDRGNEIDYRQYTGARVTLTSGRKAYYNGPAAIRNNQVEFNAEPAALRIPGPVTGQLDLFNSEQNLATTYFNFSVISDLAGTAAADLKFYVNEIERLIRELEDAASQAPVIQEIAVEAQKLLDTLIANGWFSIGDVSTTTLLPDADADVDISAVENVLNFKFSIPRGEKGEKGSTGGVTVPMSGFFTLYVDNNADLFTVFADEEAENPFLFDEETGDLFYVIDRGDT